LAEDRLEGTAFGGVFEAVAGEDLAVGEEVGEDSGEGQRVSSVRASGKGGVSCSANVLRSRQVYLLVKQMSAAPRLQRRLEGSNM
jgi:hypothetical protein